MRVFVILEARFLSNRAAVWGPPSYEYLFWQRYLDVFEEVVVVARVNECGHVPPLAVKSSGAGARFFRMPYYVGPCQFLTKIQFLRSRAREVASLEGAFILRVPGAIGSLVSAQLRRLQKPFSVEVVGDPYDSLNYKALRSKWSHVTRPWAVRQLRKQCAEAQCVAYVTFDVLQRRYPAGAERFATHYSSVHLPTGAFATFANNMGITARAPHGSRRRLVFVGSLAQLYKAPNVLISALSQCVNGGLDAELIVIGDGKCRKKLEGQANTLGLADRVRFVGEIPSGEPVYQWLRSADLFVLPSLVEGLPRAMIEAMACGVPCIGSTIGGIPELLPAEDMAPPGDARALAKKIVEVLSDRSRMQRMASRNLQKAKEYRSQVLRERRIEFYQRVKEATEAWERGCPR